MRKFDYSFLNNGMLPANLVNLTSNIAALKTMAGVRKEEYTQIFTELEAVAKVQSIKSSNAIEGIVTSDERIAAIVNQNSAPLNHNEAEIAGYRDALNEIHLGYEHIDFRQSDILRLHEMMMSFAGYEYGGQYKTDDNVILEIDTVGNRRVRFRPTPASETPKAMEQLELAYLDARSDANINQLLLIPCVILDFLCIHPFNDGNGRMSRLLTLLLLYRSGYIVGKYISIEKLISDTKETYYEALQASSYNWHEGTNDYAPFVTYMLGVLVAAYRDFESRIELLTTKGLSKPDRVREIIKNHLGKITKSEIMAACPDISQITVQRALAELLKSGEIIKLGGGRYTSYTWNRERE